jgi:hypothetical protein
MLQLSQLLNRPDGALPLSLRRNLFQGAASIRSALLPDMVMPFFSNDTPAGSGTYQKLDFYETETHPVCG